jgi:hypothetical protein
LFGGYSERSSGPGRWLIVARTNAYTRRGFAHDMAIHRAAELLAGEGFGHMQVVDYRFARGNCSLTGSCAMHAAGEYVAITVRGARDASPPIECRARDRRQCVTIETSRVLAEPSPSLGLR